MTCDELLAKWSELVLKQNKINLTNDWYEIDLPGFKLARRNKDCQYKIDLMTDDGTEHYGECKRLPSDFGLFWNYLKD